MPRQQHKVFSCLCALNRFVTVNNSKHNYALLRHYSFIHFEFRAFPAETNKRRETLSNRKLNNYFYLLLLNKYEINLRKKCAAVSFNLFVVTIPRLLFAMTSAISLDCLFIKIRFSACSIGDCFTLLIVPIGLSQFHAELRPFFFLKKAAPHYKLHVTVVGVFAFLYVTYRHPREICICFTIDAITLRNSHAERAGRISWKKTAETGVKNNIVICPQSSR